jgi:hypothetical protein
LSLGPVHALALSALALASASPTPPAWPAEPSSHRVLALTPEAQHGRNWCWAATGSSVLRYLAGTETPSQCSVAAASFPDFDCRHPACADRSGNWQPACDQAGEPAWPTLGWEADRTVEGRALSWDALRCEIDGERPVAFVWWTTEERELGPGHMMAGIGYGEFLDGAAVAVADPRGPKLRVMPYRHYVESEIHSHGHDWQLFRRKGATRPACPARPPSNTPAPRSFSSAATASEEIPVVLSGSESDWIRDLLGLPTAPERAKAVCSERRTRVFHLSVGHPPSETARIVDRLVLEPTSHWSYLCFLDESPFYLVVREADSSDWLEIWDLAASRRYQQALRTAEQGFEGGETVEVYLPYLHVPLLIRTGPGIGPRIVPIDEVPTLFSAGEPLTPEQLYRGLADSPLAAPLGLAPAPP